MGDLSLNPSTWSLGNVAEAATEALTGSEFVGDVFGAVVGFATGDVLGGLENVGDGLENVVSFATDPRVSQAASDAFGTGGTTPPNETTPSQQTGGYPPTSQTGGAGGSESAGNTGGLDLPEGWANMPLEDKIITLLFALMQKKENELDEKTDAVADLEGGSGKAGGSDGPSEASKNKALADMQKAQDELSQMNTMLTNMIKAFDETAKTTIRNIGG